MWGTPVCQLHPTATQGLALGSSHTPVKLGGNPSDELACPGHRKSPGSPTGDKQPALPNQEGWQGHFGDTSRQGVLQSLQLPSRAPLKINLHSHRSSGLILPPFPPSWSSEAASPAGQERCDTAEPLRQM